MKAWTRLLSAVFVVALTFGSAAKASEERELCRLFGDMVYQMSQNRDNGWSIYETRALILQDFDDDIVDASLVLVDMVYERPWLAPEREATNFIRECTKNIRNVDKRPTSF